MILSVDYIKLDHLDIIDHASFYRQNYSYK